MLHFFHSSALEAQEVSASTMQQNNVFISFLSLNVLGWRKQKKKEKKPTLNTFSIVLLLQGRTSGET